MYVHRSRLGEVKVVDSRDLPGEFNYDSSIKELQAYLTQTKLLSPDQPHPDIEFLKTLFSNCSFAQNQSAIAPTASSLEETVRLVMNDAFSQSLAKMQKTLLEYSKRN